MNHTVRFRKPNEPEPDLDVGVVYTHERRFMPALLSSLYASAGHLRARLVLVDNASGDGVEQWKPHFPCMKVIRNQQRLGYTANLNRILEVSTAPYVLLMNTDMYFSSDDQCLCKMVRFMDTHEGCGISTCRVCHPSGEFAYAARRFPTLRAIAARRLGMSHVFRQSLQSYLYMEEDNRDSFECDWVSGCFMMIRKEAIEETGRFDGRFPKYFEDVDICLRMAQHGWQVMFNGAAYCYHYEQRASKKLFSHDALSHLESYRLWLGKWGFSPRMSLPRQACRRRAARHVAERRHSETQRKAA